MYSVPYLVRLLDRRQVHQARRLRARHRLPVAWSGFRGGISLAAALAVPAEVAGRDLIVVATFGVILTTLILHGLTLPAVLRWARLPADHDVREERRTAHRAAIEAALAELPAAAERLDVPSHVLDRVRDDFEGGSSTSTPRSTTTANPRPTARRPPGPTGTPIGCCAPR